MPTKPFKKNLTNVTSDVLNAIRNNASVDYRNYVPKATPDADSVRTIGAVIMDHVAFQNEFINALINRIGRVVLSSKMYENPWSMFKAGMLEYGETIEDIFVNLAKPYEYDINESVTRQYQLESADVRSAFYMLNYRKFYKVTITEPMLRQAFLSYDGVANLIAKIVDQLYSSANYDEFLTMKYMLARWILDGHMTPVDIDSVTTDNMKSIIGTVKGVSNNLTFLSPNYNLAGVHNYTNKDDQFIIVNSNFDAKMDVEVLAAAFNMDKAEFFGHRVLVDSFGSLDTARLAELFKGDTNYVEISQAELTALDAIPAILVSRDFFQIYDNLFQFTEKYNGEGLYWNYFNHVWKIFACSPFANAAVFVPSGSTVTGVTITPSALTIVAGGTGQLNATVEGTGFPEKSVTWSSNSDAITVDDTGLVSVASGTAKATTAEITATSTFDTTKTGTATITVA